MESGTISAHEVPGGGASPSDDGRAGPRHGGVSTLWQLGIAGGAAALAVAGAVLLWEPEDVDSLKLAMTILAMLGVTLGWIADRQRWAVASRAVTGLLVALALVAITVESGGRAYRLFARDDIAEWNAFHYVLGTKYFPELGYADFYNGMALADAETDDIFSSFRTVRDLHTNEHINVRTAIRRAREAGIRERFSDGRWEELKRDLHRMLTHRGARRWSGPLNDLGFHPSPAWMIPHLWVLNTVDISRQRTLTWLCSADIPLVLLTLVLVGWAFGLRTAAVSGLWLHLYFGNTGLLVGGYFHYDWLFWTVAAVALYRKGFPLLAGVALAYPAMMRGFPGLLALYPGIQLVKPLLRRAWPRPRHARFVAALVVACLALVALSSCTRQGFGAWTEWREKISLHADTHPTGRQRIGVKYLYAHDPEVYGWTPSVRERAECLAANAGKARAAMAVLAAVFVLAMLNRRDHDGILLALGLIVAVLVLSRYYFSVWVLLFTWTATDRRRLGNLLANLGFWGMVLVVYLMPEESVIHRYHVYNQLVVAYFLAFAAFFLQGDARELVHRWRARRKGAAVAVSAP